MSNGDDLQEYLQKFFKEITEHYVNKSVLGSEPTYTWRFEPAKVYTTVASFGGSNYVEDYKPWKVFFNKRKGSVLVVWKDGSKTRVVARKGDVFSEEAGVAIAVCKKFFGSWTDFLKLIDVATKNAEKENQK